MQIPNARPLDPEKLRFGLLMYHVSCAMNSSPIHSHRLGPECAGPQQSYSVSDVHVFPGRLWHLDCYAALSRLKPRSGSRTRKYVVAVLQAAPVLPIHVMAFYFLSIYDLSFLPTLNSRYGSDLLIESIRWNLYTPSPTGPLHFIPPPMF